MSAQGAQVIDLTEYRQRRKAQEAPAPRLAPVVWVPVWMWVPLWPMP